MWDLSSEVQWWEEWQLRILVLGSLFLQLVLFVGAMTRQVPALKSCMWLAYIGADAVAIYGLSTLFNRHKLPAGATSSSPVEIEILWAPVLLLHLGGQHTFTAYSLADNELWGRHLVTLASQATVALYVFCKSWSGGDKNLLRASILLFVVGILKSIYKAFSLKAASFNSQMTSSAVYPQRRAPRASLYMIIRNCLVKNALDDAVSLRHEEDHDISLDEYVQKARDLARETKVDPKYKAEGFYFQVKEFVDLSNPYSHRLRGLSSYLKIDGQGATSALQQKLGSSFVKIYTDYNMVFGVPGCLLNLLLPFITLSSAVLFGQSHKHGYKEEDIKVTYIVLWCTTVLSFLTPFTCPCLCGSQIWSTTPAQHSLVSFTARRRNPTVLMKLSAVMGFSDYVNKHWYIAHESHPASVGVIGLVLQHARDGWKEYILDEASYRRFNNLRGQWAISKDKQARDLRRRLLWSLQVPFDHSVLVWHVATELCLHHPKTSPTAGASTAAHRYSKVISNYMIYLLLIRPEMLMPGTRQALFTNTSDDMEAMLKHTVQDGLLDETSVARRILLAAQSPSLDARRVGPWILKACKLAEDLMELLGDDERWLLIQGVWVEMLCYSAGRCRGYLHAKTMAEGVELLTYIWLLLSRMGMETFADKFQRPEPAQAQETEIYIHAGGSASSQTQGTNAEEEIQVDAVDSASEPQDGPVEEIVIAVE